MTGAGVPAIPASLVRAIAVYRGEEAGRAWLDTLPARIDGYLRRWRLTAQTIAEGGATSCCVYCVNDDRAPVVLKIPVDPAAGRAEACLLRWWADTDVAPAVLHDDPDTGVFVMSRIVPGSMLAGTPAADDAGAFSRLLTQLHRPAPGPLPLLPDLAEVMNTRVGWARERATDPRYTAPGDQPAAGAALDAACSVLEVLLRTTRARHALHADLHPRNILDGGQSWCVIDPFGAVGDINSDPAFWAVCQTGPHTIAPAAVLLDQLGAHPLLDPDRLRAWAWVVATLEYRPYQDAGLAARMREVTAAWTAAALLDTVRV
ncbi:streptomycin 6-kinase [Nocardia sp. GAS34]|uniref:aminoglycoside phosphotransferase family protein n=1 Tax=unclassified Nocardia TaxID=2637762 RepID=UPI003D20E530